jgi:hypothetical protein
MVRVIIVLLLITICSCEKDEITLNKAITPPKTIEVKKVKTKKIKLKRVHKKRKFILFRIWKKYHGDSTKTY